MKGRKRDKSSPFKSSRIYSTLFFVRTREITSVALMNAQIAMVTAQRAAKSNHGAAQGRTAPLCQNFLTAVITLEHPNECKITEILWHVKCQHIMSHYLKRQEAFIPAAPGNLFRETWWGHDPHAHREETSVRPMK